MYLFDNLSHLDRRNDNKEKNWLQKIRHDILFQSTTTLKGKQQVDASV